MPAVSMREEKYSIRRSGIHGRGLFAAQSFAARETVAEYKGEQIGKTESRRRQARRKRIFIFEFDAQHDLDGGGLDNSMRFANHSCAPNCEAVAAEEKISLRTLRSIAVGEELTFDYGYKLAAFPGHPCRCGAQCCAGFIVAQSERWRVRRLLNRPGRSLLAGRISKTREVHA